MIKIYKGQFISKAAVEKALLDADIAYEKWRISEGIPAPIFHYHIIKIRAGEEWEFVDHMDSDEEMYKKVDDEDAAYAAAKLKAQTVPSPKYGEYRGLDYPFLVELNDAKAKQTSTDLKIKEEGVAQEAKYYADCLAVKALYKKPS